MLNIPAGLSTGSRMANRDTRNADRADTLETGDCRHDKQRTERVLHIKSENPHLGQSHECLVTNERLDMISASASSLPTQEQLTFAEIDAQLRRSGVITENVQCEVQTSTVILSGRVRRYHHLQIVLHIAMRCRDGRRIVNKIHVGGIADS